MRKVLTASIAFILCFSYNCYSQWTLSGSNLYPTATTTNVGIGNTAPGVKLDITGDTRSSRFCSGVLSPFLADNFTYDSKSTYNYGISWVADSWFAGGNTNWLSGWGGIKLFTSATPRLSITNSGNVGIGTIIPGGMMHIKGTTSNADIILENNNSLAKWQLISIQSTNNFGIADVISGTTPFVINKGAPNNALTVTNNGNVIINENPQQNTTYKLDVGGAARANKVVVNTTGADFVFDSSYELRSLDSVAKYIAQNKHLPGIAPAVEMQKDGLDLGDNQTKLLQKIEELTLYLVEQNKKINEQESKIQQILKDQENLRVQNKALQQEINKEINKQSK